MSTTTPNLTLTLYDSTTDQAVTFATFRAVWGGTATTSNFYRIDTWAGTVNSSITTLQNQRGAIPVAGTYISANYYEATVSSISSYVTGMSIALKLDTDSAGTVTLNINALGTKSVVKVNSSGTKVNMTGGEIQANKYYLFMYDGTEWVWVNATSSDQIYVPSGISGNMLSVDSSLNIQDSGYKASDFPSESNDSGNVIENGDFSVWQLGTSFTTVPHYKITADRWVWGQSSGTSTWSITRSSAIPPNVNTNYSARIKVTNADASIAAGDESHFRHLIEGYNMKKLYGKTCTLSFWVRSSVTGTYCISFVGGLDGTTVSQIKEYTINSANTWEYKEINITFNYSDSGWNYTNGMGLKIRFTLVSGSTFQTTPNSWQTGNFTGTSNQVNFAGTLGNTFYLNSVKLNIGLTRSPDLYLSYAEKLSICKRYLHKIGVTTGGVNVAVGFSSSANTANFESVIGTEMRVAPIVSLVGVQGTDYGVTPLSSLTPVASDLRFASFDRSPSIWKISMTKTGAYTAATPYNFRLITTTGGIILNSEWGDA